MFPFPIGGGGSNAKKFRAGIMTIIFFILLGLLLTNILVKVFSALGEGLQSSLQAVGQYMGDEEVNSTLAKMVNGTKPVLFVHVNPAMKTSIALVSFVKALLTDPTSLLLLMAMSLILYFLITGEA